jgi:hypothetical protein
MRTEASIPLRGLPAIARLFVPWVIEVFRELILGVIVDTMVLALGIFGFITAACIVLL